MHTASSRAAPAGVPINRGLAVAAVLALAVAAWALASRGDAPAVALQSFDAAFADSAPLRPRTAVATTGFGASSTNFSLAPDGSFAVYTVQRGDSTSLWYRSLVDATARRIPGTNGGFNPRISPDGTRLLFVAGNRLLVVPIDGGEVRRLTEAEMVTVEWASPSRVYAMTSDGYRLLWLDPDGGVVSEQSLSSTSRCVWGWWVESERKMLCSFNETAKLVDPATSESWTITTRLPSGEPGPALAGTAFRFVGDDHLIFVTLDGELRAAAYDRTQRTVGRSVSLATGVYRDALGATQLDLSASGLLGYAPSRGQVEAQMVLRRADGSVRPLPIEQAAFLRFDLSRDRRRLAAVVGTAEGQELRIYDLRAGQRQVWQRALRIGFPAWSPSGTRIAVQVATATQSLLLLGSRGSAAAVDTVLHDSESRTDVLEFIDEETLLVRDADGATSGRLYLRERPARLDTLRQSNVFATVSPDGRRLAWHSPENSELYVSDFPVGSSRVQVATGGVEPMWFSSTELLYRSSVRWYLARFDARTGELTGPPEFWGEDPAFLDTPGWSNGLSRDGGIIYSRRTEAEDVRFLRLMPDFVQRMKAAVAAADR